METITLEQVNKEVKATTLKNEKTGKVVGDYVEVNQRVKAFRKLHPNGEIKTEMLSNIDGVCIFKATIFDETKNQLANAHAEERKDSTFINRTSYIENCETSAVGRALGFLGIGIDTSIASKEEVENARANQEERKASPKQIELIKKAYGENLPKLLSGLKLENIEDMSINKASEIISAIKNKESK